MAQFNCHHFEIFSGFYDDELTGSGFDNDVVYQDRSAPEIEKENVEQMSISALLLQTFRENQLRRMNILDIHTYLANNFRYVGLNKLKEVLEEDDVFHTWDEEEHMLERLYWLEPEVDVQLRICRLCGVVVQEEEVAHD